MDIVALLFACLDFAQRETALFAAAGFALLGHGGVSDRSLLGALRLDVYGQAGIVGARARDRFADGAVRIGLPVDRRLRVGGGIWGAAQPGAARLDVGPHVSLRLPAERAQIWIAADWRVRIAGDAEPGSGPALTLATDF